MNHFEGNPVTARAFFPFILSLFTIFTVPLSALSPENEFWDTAVEWIQDDSRLPEDSGMGLLADIRTPDGQWAAALAVCDAAFLSLRSGVPPEESFLERMRPLLVREFEHVLEDGAIEVYPRYGMPIREGERVSVPVRINVKDTSSYGHIYLVRTDEGTWFIDQWALDLSGLESESTTTPP